MIKQRMRKGMSGCIIALFSMMSVRALAQDYDSMFHKYSNEQAIMTNVDDELTIKYDGGELVAFSTVSKEKMIIGDMASGLYNSDYLFDSYFHRLKDHDEEALIPSKNGYRKLTEPVIKNIDDDDDEVFYDDSKEIQISFSGLIPRSLMRVNHTTTHTDLHMLPPFYFQQGLPIVKATYKVTAPKDVVMKFVIKGTDAWRIKQTKEENKNTITYSFTSEDLPAFKNYSDVPSNSWHALHIVPFITSYKVPHGAVTEMLSDPQHLYKYLYGFIKDVNLNGDSSIGKCVADITKGDKTDREKAQHIYQWVQHNMHYVAFEDSLGGFVPRQPAAIFQRKFGDCKDMAAIITCMCRKAGLNAYLTWIGTRSKPYNFEETPLPLVADHMISTVKIGDEWIFTDGTHPLIPFGVAPSGLQGKEALIAIDENKFKIITVPESESTNNVVIDSTFLKINDRQAFGSSSTDYKGYSAWYVEIMMMYKKNKELEDLARELNLKGSNKYVLNSYKYIHSDTGNKDCRLTANFSIDDYVQKVDKEYFINMNVNRYMEKDNIDTEGRNVAVYCKFKNVLREVVALDIPVGYHVSYMPAAASGELKDELHYNITYTVAGQKVILNKDYSLSTMQVTPQQFIQYNNIIDNLNKQYKESIVLTAD